GFVRVQGHPVQEFLPEATVRRAHKTELRCRLLGVVRLFDPIRMAANQKFISLFIKYQIPDRAADSIFVFNDSHGLDSYVDDFFCLTFLRVSFDLYSDKVNNKSKTNPNKVHINYGFVMDLLWTWYGLDYYETRTKLERDLNKAPIEPGFQVNIDKC